MRSYLPPYDRGSQRKYRLLQIWRQAQEPHHLCHMSPSHAYLSCERRSGRHLAVVNALLPLLGQSHRVPALLLPLVRFEREVGEHVPR